MKPNPKAVGIDEVVLAELKDISCRRGEPPGPLNRAWEIECHDKRLFGICLSGGGIRSATFALGVLQGLTEKGLLPLADYLSTVSGGGYIGSWLQGVLYRDPETGYQKLTRDVPEDASADPISFLRKYSNYLAPRVGLSLDAIVIPVIWLRNTLLNQTIIVAAFAALFLVLSLPGSGIYVVARLDNLSFSKTAIAIASALGAFAVVLIGQNLRKITKREFSESTATANRPGKRSGKEPAYRPGKGTESVSKFVVVPLALSVVFLLFALISWPKATDFLYAALFASAKVTFLDRVQLVLRPWGLLALILWGLLALLQWRGGFVQCFGRSSRWPKWLAWVHLTWMPLVSALFMWVLFVAVSIHLGSHHQLVNASRGIHNCSGAAALSARLASGGRSANRANGTRLSGFHPGMDGSCRSSDSVGGCDMDRIICYRCLRPVLVGEAVVKQRSWPVLSGWSVGAQHSDECVGRQERKD